MDSRPGVVHAELLPVKFSIVTPSYKQLDWLGLCIASVRDQVRPDLEIEHIVQDGGSEGLEDFARQFGARLFLHGTEVVTPPPQEGYSLSIRSERDAGMYDAINRGLKRAEGSLMAYLNCDEQYLPGTLEKVVSYFAQHKETEMLFGDVVLINQEGAALGYRRVTRPNIVHTRLVHLGTLSCATFFHRSLVEAGHLFDPTWKAIGDAVWVVGILRAGRRIALLPEPLGTFTFTGQNLSEANRGPGGEHARWARGPDAPPAWLRLPSVLHHRVGKLLSGAYKKRSLSYDIFHLGDPARRQRHEAQSLGHQWPKG